MSGGVTEMGKKSCAGNPAAKFGPAEDGAARSAGERPPREGGPGQRTLGPVSDLERHLPSEWWRTLFNSLYL